MLLRKLWSGYVTLLRNSKWQSKVIPSRNEADEKSSYIMVKLLKKGGEMFMVCHDHVEKRTVAGEN